MLTDGGRLVRTALPTSPNSARPSGCRCSPNSTTGSSRELCEANTHLEAFRRRGKGDFGKPARMRIHAFASPLVPTGCRNHVKDAELIMKN